MPVVYEAVNAVNLKSYVGVSRQSLNERQLQHLREARGSRSKCAFHRALRKYGPESFTWRVRASLPTAQEALLAERILIALEAPAYNTTSGGEGCRGLKHSAEARAKMSATRKGVPKSEAWKAVMSASKTGKKRPEWVCERIREGRRDAAARKPPGWKVKRAPCKESTKLKISAALKARNAKRGEIG